MDEFKKQTPRVVLKKIESSLSDYRILVYSPQLAEKFPLQKDKNELIDLGKLFLTKDSYDIKVVLIPITNKKIYSNTQRYNSEFFGNTLSHLDSRIEMSEFPDINPFNITGKEDKYKYFENKILALSLYLFENISNRIEGLIEKSIDHHKNNSGLQLIGYQTYQELNPLEEDELSNQIDLLHHQYQLTEGIKVALSKQYEGKYNKEVILNDDRIINHISETILNSFFQENAIEDELRCLSENGILETEVDSLVEKFGLNKERTSDVNN